jgi:hypothetical protein
VSERTLGSELGAEDIREADAIVALLDLNSYYIRAFGESDLDWYYEQLSGGFVWTLADGKHINKTEILERNAQSPDVTDLSSEIWRRHDGRWEALAAQLTTVAKPNPDVRRATHTWLGEDIAGS